ncbi:uncharacterized protein G2W53_024636 [Senna tora]|uniref:Uncharacterized protein n=1 Tax=Senna tora TaxID=362788 RepID=A0A834TDI2_9FABA|nr:uncharacterized protein G2W53_024636 [Senna tora]
MYLSRVKEAKSNDIYAGHPEEQNSPIRKLTNLLVFYHPHPLRRQKRCSHPSTHHKANPILFLLTSMHVYEETHSRTSSIASSTSSQPPVLAVLQQPLPPLSALSFSRLLPNHHSQIFEDS